MNSPTLNFEKVTFSDGTSLDLATSDVVVFVGPNNSGKSLALAELEIHLATSDGTDGTKVIKAANTRQEGSPEEYKQFVKENIQLVHQGNRWFYTSFGGGINSSTVLEQLLPTYIHSFKSLFCKRISTETRILDSNPVDAIDILNDTPEHPIHMIFRSADIELRISKHFRRAFAEDLIADRASSSKWNLLVGQRLTPLDKEDRITPSYLSRVRDATVQLSQQGDGMRSFASVILHLLAPTTFTLLLLDEPEAFLHPPQARILGEIIATEKQHNAQLFLATHSVDVLEGLTNGYPEHLRIVRMQRDGNVNRIKELDKEIVKKISYDPVMRYTSVLSGLFHERVFVCESDADCMFYKSILDLPNVHGESHLDVHFVHANGKHRMAAIAEILASLDVPVDIITDIDVLDNISVLEAV
ncbi:MAG: ATP-binding protein [Candidatus Poribacteria bacterium]|nr:ATP-binding protein [Candidatus Poribacteria bacterium]